PGTGGPSRSRRISAVPRCIRERSPVAPTSQLSSELVGGDVGSVTANAGRSHLDDVDAQVVSQLRPLGGCHLSPAVDLATEDLDVGVSRRWRVNHALI